MKAAGYGDSKLTSICGERMMGTDCRSRTHSEPPKREMWAVRTGWLNNHPKSTPMKPAHASFTPEPARLNFQDSHLRDSRLDYLLNEDIIASSFLFFENCEAGDRSMKDRKDDMIQGKFAKALNDALAKRARNAEEAAQLLNVELGTMYKYLAGT